MKPNVWTKPCEAGACVEVIAGEDGVQVRDSRDLDTVLSFTLAEWEAFCSGVREGTFDLGPA